MKLDKRIVDRKYIFDCFNADMAKEFIGEDCYMTNDIELLKDLDRVNIYKLDKIEDGFYNAEEDEYFDFCLPVILLGPEWNRQIYCRGRIYTPYTYRKPKLDEKGYFTNDLEAFVNFEDPELEYIFGELIDYNDDYEHRYCCSSKWVDNWGDTDYVEENYAFYIPESSIPQEKQGWYRSRACNTSVYSEYYRNDHIYITPRISIETVKSPNRVRRHNELLFTVNELEKIIDLIQDSTVLDSNTQAKTVAFLKSYKNVLKERLERLDLEQNNERN